MAIKIIAAISRNGVIGRNGKIPWQMPEDLKRFKKITMGHSVVMGRKTWESLPKRPLPGRENIILTSSVETDMFVGGSVVRDWDNVLERAGNEDLFVIGGAELYRKALPIATDFHLTEVLINVFESGGKLILFPYWPTFGFNQKDWAEWGWKIVEIESDTDANPPWIYRHLKR